jgi:lipopolysaccharide/colanic/teichoic acid biosynthesis glycosyltransferase
MCKRAFDITLASLGLVLSSPLWLVVPLAIYLEDRGSVLFLQERCGQGGKTFQAIKFRTMRYQGEDKNLVVDMENDPRVTRVGRLLRATALDELPALINILKGDLSFVGPKPLPFKIEADAKAFRHSGGTADEAKEYDNISQVPGYDQRGQVKPGLTGMAQVYTPKDINHEERFRYDNMYVEKMSFWLDIKLILLSFWITFRGRWEHRER